MRNTEVSAEGMILAAVLALLGTVGNFLTTARGLHSFDSLWLGLFVMALLTLSAAAVNFDPKRWLS